jgi:putative transposase
MPEMPQKKHKPEEIVAKLRQVDVLLSQGRPVAEAIRTISVTPFTYFRWGKEFGGLKSDQVKRLKELEKENERLRKAVSDLTLEKLTRWGEMEIATIHKKRSFQARRVPNGGKTYASTRLHRNVSGPNFGHSGRSFAEAGLRRTVKPPYMTR